MQPGLAGGNIGLSLGAVRATTEASTLDGHVVKGLSGATGDEDSR